MHFAGGIGALDKSIGPPSAKSADFRMTVTSGRVARPFWRYREFCEGGYDGAEIGWRGKSQTKSLNSGNRCPGVSNGPPSGFVALHAGSSLRLSCGSGRDDASALSRDLSSSRFRWPTQAYEVRHERANPAFILKAVNVPSGRLMIARRFQRRVRRRRKNQRPVRDA